MFFYYMFRISLILTIWKKIEPPLNHIVDHLTCSALSCSGPTTPINTAPWRFLLASGRCWVCFSRWCFHAFGKLANPTPLWTSKRGNFWYIYIGMLQGSVYFPNKALLRGTCPKLPYICIKFDSPTDGFSRMTPRGCSPSNSNICKWSFSFPDPRAGKNVSKSWIRVTGMEDPKIFPKLSYSTVDGRNPAWKPPFIY